jgi:hypothetical protein
MIEEQQNLSENKIDKKQNKFITNSFEGKREKEETFLSTTESETRNRKRHQY